ncbi:MAG: Lar family restriction alleviation protein [Acutalibacteraceae bacterium]
MVDEKLKPCPFCGGKAEMFNGVDYSTGKVTCFVRCTKCLSATSYYKDDKNNFDYMESAIAAWNRRFENGK